MSYDGKYIGARPEGSFIAFNSSNFTYSNFDANGNIVDQRIDATALPCACILIPAPWCPGEQAGDFSDSEIVVMLGENGTGKTTFIRMFVFDKNSLKTSCLAPI